MMELENLAILVVDDTKSMRSIIKKLLMHLNIGREIHFAENGVDGLRCMRERRVDIAIVDWKMPVMNGAQMLDAIRNDRLLRDIPVLMVTAECERDVVYEVAEIEVDAYLLKPLTPAMLEEKIKAVVHKVNNPDEATLYSRRARILDEDGDTDSAIECLEKAVRLKPNASRIRRNLGALFEKTGQITEMEKCYLEAAACNLQDAVTRHLLSNFYWQKNEWGKSVRYLCEALTLTNRYNDHAVKMGKELLSLKQNGLAVSLFTRLMGKLEKHLPLKVEILDLCMGNGEMGFAKSLLETLLKDFPSQHELLFKAGMVFEALEDDDTALEYYMAADKNMVRPIESKLRIAQIFLRKDKVIQADDIITQVLRIAPENEEALALRRAI